MEKKVYPKGERLSFGIDKSVKVWYRSRHAHDIAFKSPQNSRFTLGLLEAGRMRLFIATLRQLRVLQETPWMRLVLLDLEKSIPKEERLSFGKCEI